MPKIKLGDHWAYFGDGNAAQMVDSKEYIKEKNGGKYIKFIFLPSRLIEQTYDLSEVRDGSSGMVIREFPWTDVIWLQKGINRTRCWILTDFMGGATPASRRYEEMSGVLKDTERLLRSAQAAKNRAYEELDKERKQQMESIKTKVNMVKEVAKARGKTDDMGGDGYDFEEPTGGAQQQ